MRSNALLEISMNTNLNWMKFLSNCLRLKIELKIISVEIIKKKIILN